MTQKYIKNETFEVKVEEKAMEYLEAVYLDYRAKQDIINSIIDLHSYDENDTIVNSKPFKTYEKQFAEAKYKYDQTMLEIQTTYVPQELQETGCKWEADFENCVIKVTPM